MSKYKITIEFKTESEVRFPAEAMLLEAMIAQVESISDGTFDEVSYEVGDCKVTKVE